MAIFKVTFKENYNSHPVVRIADCECKAQAIQFYNLDGSDIENYEIVELKNAYLAYEQVRQSGHWNMITEANQAASEANLEMADYLLVIKNYTRLHQVYGEKN